VTDAGNAPGRPRARGARLARLVATVVVLATLIAVAACGDPGKAAAGIVIAVDAPGGEVTGFTLRTQQGETLAFEIGSLEVDGAAFAASHLVEHAITLQPIAVAYRVEDGVNVVHRMVDAPWAAPS
jgi:hypothetical protein